MLCIVVLSSGSRLVEPDDYAYRASIVAITQGHLLTLSTAQVDRLAAQLPGPVAGAPGVVQWVQLPGGRWISEKDPGYPFLAAPFQALGIIRLAPLFYGALGCLGLFFGARRWLGRYGGAAAVALFCPSGAALASAAVAVAMFGLGAWSFAIMREFQLGGIHQGPPGAVPRTAQGRQPGTVPQALTRQADVSQSRVPALERVRGAKSPDLTRREP